MNAKEDDVRELARHAKALTMEIGTHHVENMQVVAWVPEKKGFFELIAKAAAIRQHEGFSAIADLVSELLY